MRHVGQDTSDTDQHAVGSVSHGGGHGDDAFKPCSHLRPVEGVKNRNDKVSDRARHRQPPRREAPLACQHLPLVCLFGDPYLVSAWPPDQLSKSGCVLAVLTSPHASQENGPLRWFLSIEPEDGLPKT
jgi:hypothetical protein